MQKFRDIVLDNEGNAILSATITVTDYSSGNVSTIYSDDGVTPKANPFTSSGVDGAYEFYAADGYYNVTVTKTGFDTEQVQNIQLHDGVNFTSRLASTTIDDTTGGFHLVHYPPLSGETGVTNYEYEYGDLQRYGAAFDGSTDDDTALANAIANLAVTGTLIFKPNSTMIFTGNHTIDGGYTIFGNGATMKVAASTAKTTGQLKFSGADGFKLLGSLTIDGNRANRTPSVPVSAHLFYFDNTDGGYVEHIKAINGVADGVYWGASDTADQNTACSNITVLKVEADNNYRNNMSCVAGNSVTILEAVCTGASGTSPQAGIDIEGNAAGSKPIGFKFGTVRCDDNAAQAFLFSTEAEDCSVDKLYCKNNTGYGLQYGANTALNCHVGYAELDGNDGAYQCRMQGYRNTIGTLKILNTPAGSYQFYSESDMTDCAVNDYYGEGGDDGINWRGVRNRLGQATIKDTTGGTDSILIIGQNHTIGDITIVGHATTPTPGLKDNSTLSAIGNVNIIDADTYAGSGKMADINGTPFSIGAIYTTDNNSDLIRRMKTEQITSDGSGNFVITHNLITTPAFVSIETRDGTGSKKEVQIRSITSTAINCTLRNTDDNSAVVSTACYVTWKAEVTYT